MIEQIVELKPELKIEPLRDVCVLVDGGVRLHEGRISELVKLLVALGNAGWRSELPRSEDTGSVSTAGRSLSVTGNVWKIKGVSIRIVVAAVPKIGASEDGEGIASLVNACPTESPSSGQLPYWSNTILQAGQLVVEACREAVGSIPRRRCVVLVRVDGCREPAGIIFGG